MKILAIETSCDDTGIAILEYNKIGQPKILAGLVSSQIKIHAPWGGVVPMLAKREHQRNLLPLFKKSLSRTKLLENPKNQIPNTKQIPSSKIQILKKILERESELLKKLLPFLEKYPKPNIDYIAVTVGPGLEPALWAGINFARAISYFWNIPLLPINHIEGHICAGFIPVIATPQQRGKQSRSIASVHGIAASPLDKLGAPRNDFLPAIALIASGGHTQLILIKKSNSHGRNSHVFPLSYAIIGETRDDAAGEAFDKVAKMLGLGYPGGPIISQLTDKYKFRADHLSLNTYHLPRPMLHSGDFDFSFSGLKTAVLYSLQKMTAQQIKKQTPAIAAQFQQAVIDVLSAKTAAAAKKYNTRTIILAGGVAANKALREDLSLITKHLSLNFLVPPKNLCADNAAMIGLAACFQLRQNRTKKAGWRTIKAQANLRIS